MKNQFYLLVSILLIPLMLCACGNEPDNSSSRSPNSNRDPKIPTSVWTFIQRQNIDCKDKFLCNESMAKLVVIDSETIRYCTGALIGPKLMVTSASCLSRELKVPKMNCTENIFAVFPGTNIKNKEIAKCDQIEAVDINENIESSLWKSDLAFFKLKNEPARRHLEISTEGLSESRKLEVWKVDYIDDTEANAAVSECRPVFNSYMNPFATGPYSAMLPLTGCDFSKSNTGGLVLDEAGNLAGILSTGIDTKLKEFVLRSGLLKGKLNGLANVTNLACARLPNELQSSGKNEECSKTTSQAKLDKLRASLLKTNKIHQRSIAEIERKLEEHTQKYFNLTFKFFADNRNSILELHLDRPKCFTKVNSWIHEYRSWGRIRTYGVKKINIPHYRLKTAFNSDLQVISATQDLGEKEYVISFNPRAAWKFGKSYVNIQSELFDSQSELKFEDIPKSCSKY